VSDIQDTTLVKAMYESIRKKFQTVSRAAQMNLWYKLLAFKINPSVPIAGVATQLQDLYAEMKAVNVQMHGEILLGFVLQAAIMSSLAGFKKDFKQWVKIHIQQDPQLSCPSFNCLVYYFDIYRQQHKLAASQPAARNLPSNGSSLMLISPAAQEEFDVSAFLADVDKVEWSNALNFYAVTAKKCWTCGGETHYAQDCLQKSQLRSNSRPVGTIYGQLLSGFQVTLSRFPNSPPRQGPTMPTNAQQNARHLADYYRPQHNQGQSTRPM
jgi:hypothetical protein